MLTIKSDCRELFVEVAERLRMNAYSSPEIATWLSQFKSDEDKLIAKQMLLRLRFVSRGRFSLWFKEALDGFLTE